MRAQATDGDRSTRGNPQRRQQILDAAAAVFADRGIHQARMDDIVAASGLSKGALYWYFASKDELISGLVEPAFAADLAQLRALVSADGTVTERLTGFTAQHAALLTADARITALTVEFYAYSLRNEAVRQRLGTYYTEAVEPLAALIGQGRARGEFVGEADIDDRAAAGALLSAFEGVTLIWTLAPTGSLADHLRTTLRLTIRGLGGTR